MASQMISYMILTSVILTLVCSVSLYSWLILEDAIQDFEFEEGKSLLIRMADMVEEVSTASGPTAIHEIDLKPRTNRPCFYNNIFTIFVGIEGGDVLLQGITSGIILYGGPHANAVDRKLFGTHDLIVPDISGPLARVVEGKGNGPWVSLDFARVRITHLGTFWYTNPFGDFIPGYLNRIRISFINMTFGTIRLPYARVGVAKITLRAFYNPANDFNILVMVGGKSETIHISGEDVRGTIVEILVSNVKVKSIGDA